ncbi:MAG: fumarylacetoacetate hydrolase family protein [Pirellulaceae bacterium]
MRLITYQSETGPRVAARRGEDYVDLHHADATLPHSIKCLLAMGPAVHERIHAAIAQADPIDLSTCRILPTVVDPQKILCIGLNYADHAAETGATVGDEPVVFNKFATCLRADGEAIELPPVSDQVDYEAELVVVIGTQGKNIPLSEAMSHVGGYCVGHDVSARDWQKNKPGKQWLLGKSFDSFAPLGPELVTPDEVPDPHNLRIRCHLNDETVQDSSTSQLIFKIDALITYLSQVCTLMPGDLIYTGTPPGVGMARNPPRFLKAGDVVQVEIESLGKLTNPVVAAK